MPDDSANFLRDFIQEVGAIDLRCVGLWHTWSHWRHFGDRIKERLDRALALAS